LGGLGVETKPELIIKKIDAIVHELQELRRTIQVQIRPPETNLAEQLYGALGRGSWEEYDHDLEWRRFGP
jgi:hypothetical protein